MEADLVSEDGTIDGWVDVTVVGKLYGRGGNSDLIGLFVETDDGARVRVPWPHESLRAIA